MSETRSGKFIVIEGTDGTGKTEQTKRLLARLEADGFEVESLDFPQYGKPSALFVERYLRGEYGDWRVVGPQEASLFFAIDRFAAAPRIRQAIREGKVVLSNRFVASNMGHQGAKLGTPEEREAFFNWNYRLEYGFFGTPRPGLNVVLHVPAVIAYELVGRKAERAHLHGNRRDVHESDLHHLEQAESTYLEIVKLYPRDFKVVECAPSGATRPEEMFSPEEIHAMVWSLAEPIISR